MALRKLEPERDCLHRWIARDGQAGLYKGQRVVEIFCPLCGKDFQSLPEKERVEIYKFLTIMLGGLS